MGGGNHFLSVYNSSHAYQMKRLTAYLPMSIMIIGVWLIQRYSSSSSTEGKKFHRGGDEEEQHDVREERAPSTAQEFMKVAADKNIRQGNSPSQRTRDEEETTTPSDSDSDSDEEEEKVDDFLPPPSTIGPTS